MQTTKAIRARLFWFVEDPAVAGDAAWRYIEDGLVYIVGGLIKHIGPTEEITSLLLPEIPVVDHRPHILMPGFIDMHLHFPQTQVIASYGAQLLDWLNKYTFPEELRYADPALCAANAKFFIDTLLAHGTTTAVAYGSVHPQSMEAYFSEALSRHMRMIGGKVMMDRNAPSALLDTPQRGYDESKALIDKWHGKGRLSYAISPRFAITSTEAQLEVSGTLVKENPTCYLQTHISENLAEIAFVRELFPNAKDYTDVYESYGLLGSRALMGHCIHLSQRELSRFAETESVAVFCPTSNLFIGSGLFNWAKTTDAGVRIGLATDIGGGTSYSMLQTAAEGYKVLQLLGQSWSPFSAFHAMTLGNAKALKLQDKIGSLEIGHEADLVVLDARATPAMAMRMERVSTLMEELFVLMTMGDDRAIAATYIMGERSVRGV